MAVPLLAELKRRTQVIAPSPAGYITLPVDVALNTKVIDANDWSEAEAALVFFMSGFSTKRRNLPQVAADLASPLSGSITSLPPSGWIASLPTSTAAEPISLSPVSEPNSVEIPQ
jgi:hypothetical protein